DEADVTADGLFRRVSVHPLCRGIPRRNDALQRLADDRIVRRIDDGGEASHRHIARLGWVTRFSFHADGPLTTGSQRTRMLPEPRAGQQATWFVAGKNPSASGAFERRETRPE